MTRRHVLVGGGPATVAAAESIRAADPRALITIVAADGAGYYSRPGLAYYLAKEVPETGLFPFTDNDFAALSATWLNDRVASIDAPTHTVALASGLVLPYDRLLLATGSLAVALDAPGADLDGVVKLDDMPDARDLIRRSRTARTAVVVGGGITALEIVEGLRERGVSVNYFLRKDRYWADVLSEAESRIVEDGLRHRGVEVHDRTELARVLGEGGRVAGVETTDGARIACEVVAVAIGVLPQKGIAESAGLACGRGVLVDECLRSSDEHIFAAGDLAEVIDPGTGHPTIEVLWSSAVAKARVAGFNMAGEPTRRYVPAPPLNVTRLAGFKITIMGTVGSGEAPDMRGISRGDSETWRATGGSSTVERQVDGAHVRLVLGERTILGAVVMGDQTLSFALQELIGAHADVAPILSDLTNPSADLAEKINGFWTDWKAARA